MSKTEFTPTPGTLKLGEPHPAAFKAKYYIMRRHPDFLNQMREAFASLSLSGHRESQVCSDTLNRLMTGQPASDRYILGCAWVILEHELGAEAEDAIDEPTRPFWNPENVWDEHPQFLTDDWCAEVANGDTRTGYIDWVNHQLDMRACLKAVSSGDLNAASDIVSLNTRAQIHGCSVDEIRRRDALKGGAP